MIISPLEQFIIYSFLINSNINMYYLVILFIFLLLLFINNTNLINNHIEWWYLNLINIYKNIFIILTIWLFILLSNLIGMIPYTFTLTSQFIIVLSITIPLFISINLYGIYLHGFNILYLLLPTGVPILLTPLISILELFSYLIRILSLTLRLTANMIAGHILMKILLSIFIHLPFISLLILPFIILELIVSLLQAYVYIILLINYYQDVLLPH